MQIKKNNHKNNKIQLAICYQSNAWRRYSQILIWKCIFPFSSLTRCSHKKADSTVMDPLSAEIWRKLVPRERDNSMNVILQRPILRLSHNNSDIPRVKCISRGRKRKELGNEVEIWTHWLRMTQGTLERGAETCNCCKTRLATSQPLISSQKRAKRAWMRLRRITNQEEKITGLLESLRWISMLCRSCKKTSGCCKLRNLVAESRE